MQNWMTQKIFKTKHFSLQHPFLIKYIDNNNLCVPRSVLIEGQISYGGSSGSGINLLKKAQGEYWERNHFLTGVPKAKIGRLCDISPASHRDKLIDICDTTNKAALLNHAFSWTTVYDIYNDTPFDYFYNTVSLRTLKTDAPFLKHTDSIGCACHITKHQSLQSSMYEFIERQALVGSFISKNYRYRISPDVLTRITPYQTVYQNLIQNGTLYLFEIGQGLPGYSVIIFYFSDSLDDAVQYSVGSNSGPSLREAINGAFNELYQSYTMLYQSNQKVDAFKNKAGASYHSAFFGYNQQETKSLIPFFEIQKEIKSVDFLQTAKTYSFDEIKNDLKAQGYALFYYHHYDEALKLHFTKVLSYDFFAHMNLKVGLSLDVLYAKRLHITKENAYLNPLPFP